MTLPVSSPVAVCNLALLQIAARAQVQSINPSDGTPAGDACTQLYQPTIDAYSRAALWNCLRFQTGPPGGTYPPPLQLLKAAPFTPEAIANPLLAAPPQPWLYEYALPPDCLRARFLVPLVTTATTTAPLTTAGGFLLPALSPVSAIPYTVALDLDANGNEIQVILTNLENAQLVYTRRINNVALWDAQFLQGAKAALAVWLAMPLSGSAALTNAAMQIAKAMLDAARITDANEGPQSMDRPASWISARYGNRFGDRPAGFNDAGWDAFSFPNGESF